MFCQMDVEGPLMGARKQLQQITDDMHLFDIKDAPPPQHQPEEETRLARMAYKMLKLTINRMDKAGWGLGMGKREWECLRGNIDCQMWKDVVRTLNKRATLTISRHPAETDERP